jgi:hypothetical protein
MIYNIEIQEGQATTLVTCTPDRPVYVQNEWHLAKLLHGTTEYVRKVKKIEANASEAVYYFTTQSFPVFPNTILKIEYNIIKQSFDELFFDRS